MTRRLRLLGFDDELATAERYALQIAREKSASVERLNRMKAVWLMMLISSTALGPARAFVQEVGELFGACSGGKFLRTMWAFPTAIFGGSA